ncbi:hypothetical protein UZ36_04510 [Candidatus Nitromaritima sp. SCGC AAA799-C22]|nr:hypothetical protein UZ36_04510 [Candidatus Nitromaritima sp. SCGC AAA799-C22]
MTKRKLSLIAFILAGSLLFTAVHSTAMAINMGSMDSVNCLAQVPCGACAILMNPDSKSVTHSFSAVQMVPDSSSELAEAHSLIPYHPPR